MARKQSVTPKPPARTIIQPDDLALIRDARGLAERAAALKAKGCHLIAPATRVSHLAESFGVALTVIDVDPDPVAGQVYNDPTAMQPGQLAFGRTTLQFISLAAGLEWLPSSGCTSNPDVKMLWRFRADAAFLGYGGQAQTINGSSEVDLRDGSPQMGGWSPNKWRYLVAKNETAIKQRRARRDRLVWTINGWDEEMVRRTRRFGLRLAETKAKSAAIRSLGVKSSYTLEELSRPFVVFRMVYLPDMNDPEIRMSVHQNAMRSAGMLYGNQQTPFPGAPLE